MTPYTIRERRANIAAHEQAEAYPGQKEKLLESLIAHDREQAAAEAERAAEARHGGRYISEQLGSRFGEDAKTLRKMQDTGDPAKVSQYWAYSLSPSGSVYPSSGRETTARYAQGAARIGGVDWEHSAYWQPQRLPESAFDWPIYRAAVAPDLSAANEEFERAFEAGRGRFREGMSIARRIYFIPFSHLYRSDD